MNGLAKKMHEAAARTIVSNHPDEDARRALIGALRAVIDDCAARGVRSVSLSELRTLLIDISESSPPTPKTGL